MNQEKIGIFIAKLRKEKNMTQQELADKLGITDRAISKWERGRGLPDYSLIKPLCDELDISINDLLTGEKITKKDYQEKLEENIINIAIDNKKTKNKLIIKLKITLIIAIIVIYATCCYLHNEVKISIKYDDRIMKCNFNNNELIYITLGNGLQTEFYKRIIDNKMYIITNNTIRYFDKDKENIDYDNHNINIDEDEHVINTYNQYLGKNITYDNIIVYYINEPLNKIKKLNDKEFTLKLNRMFKMCSIND